MFKLSDEAALKETKKLLSAGVVKSEGRGRVVLTARGGKMHYVDYCRGMGKRIK